MWYIINMILKEEETRWQPPVKPLEIGDMIWLRESLTQLPSGGVLRNRRGDTVVKVEIYLFQIAGREDYFDSDQIMLKAPLEVIYVPKEEETQ